MKKYIIFVTCVLTLAWGCSANKGADLHDEHSHSDHPADHKHEEEHDHSTHKHDDAHAGHDGHEHGQGDEIILSAEQAKLLGLTTEKVEAKPFHQVIKTSGQVVAAQGEERTVVATISGVVSYAKSAVNEGKPVTRGETLFVINASRLAEGDPVLKAKSNFEIAKRDYDRAELLVKDKLISQKEYNEIQLAYSNAKIAYEAISNGRQGGGASVTSPINGFVKSKLVDEGQFVNVGEPLMVVSQNNKLQLRADVSERYYKYLQGIQSANFKTPYDDEVYRLSDMNGQVLSYGRSSNAGENFIPVHFQFNNVGNILPGAYVEVYLLSGLREGVISVPKTALTDESGNYFVYCQLSDDEYERRAVKPGASDGNRVEIVEGLKPDDQVVTQGAYYVKLASASGAIPDGHHH